MSISSTDRAKLKTRLDLIPMRETDKEILLDIAERFANEVTAMTLEAIDSGPPQLCLVTGALIGLVLSSLGRQIKATTMHTAAEMAAEGGSNAQG